MPDQEVSALFPVKGIEATCEFGRQPDATAAEGVNVRSHDASSGRLRGGSRPGLSKHIDELVVGATPVWHLNFIVDPQAGALNADDDNQLPGYVLDPSDGGRGGPRYVPAGGGGRVPNRNIPSSGGGGSQSPQLVQSVGDYTLDTESGTTLTFPSSVGNGSVVVVYVLSYSGAPLVESVRNGGLLDYTRVGGPGYSQVTPDGASLTAWYLRATSGSSDNSVVVTLGGNGNCQVVAMEFNNASVSPLAAYSGGQVTLGSATSVGGGHWTHPFTGPSVAIAGPKRETVVSVSTTPGVSGVTIPLNGFSFIGLFPQIDALSPMHRGNCTPLSSVVPSGEIDVSFDASGASVVAITLALRPG